YPDYFARPVPAFGDTVARCCIVGLAPGMHGANASGRPFTGDHAGILLYRTLHKYGFATKPESRSADDNLALINCRITNAVKCLPPQNKPVAAEINTCNNWLSMELKALPDDHVIIALGSIAHKAVIMGLGLKQSEYRFAHAAEHELERGVLIDSYHCSRYNTQTRRLTPAMFEAVFARAREIIN
ncbi:MAG: uracil-DNA glycosylase, partial [Gammaproteobacteria bacterium]